MKKKDKFTFRCQSCGGQSPKWMGRCLECGAWETLVEERIISGVSQKKKSSFLPEPVPIDSVAVEETDRIKTGIAEFDRVLGGGLVDGSLILIGGDCRYCQNYPRPVKNVSMCPEKSLSGSFP